MPYIKSLKKAQLEKDDSDFINLIFDYIEKTLTERIAWINGEKEYKKNKVKFHNRYCFNINILIK